ncbi:MAG: hypothetical protein HY243_17910 [Proteobacteria bacterium]|nr:hypothetical protein [Pseudomonadota bacterium]
MCASTDWFRCKPWIEAALVHTHGTHAIEDIEDGIASGAYQFWCTQNSAAITEIVDYPKLKALNFFLLGGDLAELLDILEPRICAFARHKGCARVTGAGRKGWERVLKPLTYRFAGTTMFKEFS